MAGWTHSLKEKDKATWNGTLCANAFCGDGSQLTGLSAAESDPIWIASKGTYDAHLASTAIHFTSGSLWSQINANTTSCALIDPHIADTANPHSVTLAQVGGTTDHTALSNIGTNTHAQIDTHIASTAIHFTSGAIWTAIGANATSCALIDPHIADADIHFASGAIWDAVDLNTAKTSYTDAALVAATVTSCALNTAHKDGDGSDHADVAANTVSCALIDPHIADATIHFTSDALWAAVDLNTAKTSYTDAALVAATVASCALNSTHTAGDGSDHADVAANTVSCALIDPHIASAAIHFTSGALWTKINANATSCALIDPHIADGSDPHGALLTQTHITSSGTTSSALTIMTADHTTVSTALMRNIVLGTDATPPTASNFTRGTVYLQYTP